MLIHPHQKTVKHSEYWQWARSAKDTWAATLKDESQDKCDLLDEFRTEYDELVKTVPNIPPFEQLAGELRSAILRTNVQEVNARGRSKTPPVNWKQHYAHVLVGGQAMDRGFTVRGLTVTYMPRPLGIGNADTLQQRARFFGYKAGYIGYCRVYITQGVENVYRSYVEHEEDLRKRLKNFSESSRPLKDWKRAFLLDSALKPTRDQVISRVYRRGDFADKWFESKAPHVSSVDIDTTLIEANRKLFAKIGDGKTLRWIDDAGDPRRSDLERHKVCPAVSLEWVYNELLTQLTFPRSPDAHDYLGLLLQIKRYLEDSPNEKCALYLISSGKTRRRSLTVGDEINELFSGAHTSDPTIYPGDRDIGNRKDIRIQMHYLRLYKSIADSEPVPGLEQVPALAVWLPRRVSNAWLVQGQGEVVADR